MSRARAAPSPREPRRPTRKSDGLAVACLLVACVWSVLVLCETRLTPLLGGDLAVLVAFVAALALVLATRRTRPLPRAPALPLAALGAAIGFATWPAWLALVARVGETLALGPPPAERQAPGLALAAASILLAPLFEELLYREQLLTALRARCGAAAALLVTSAAFCALHVEPWAVLGSFLVGLALGGVALATGRIAPCIGLHAGLNAAALAPAWSLPGRSLGHAAWLVAAFWIAVHLYRGCRPRRFVASLGLGALLSHLGWATLHWDAVANRPAALADVAAGHCVLFVPLGPWLLARDAASWRALPLALATARLGCLAAGCCGGVEGPWGEHPTALYEALLAVGLHLAVRAAPSVRTAGVFALGFGAARLLVEPLRAAPPLGAPTVPPAALAAGWLALGAWTLAAPTRAGSHPIRGQRRDGSRGRPARTWALLLPWVLASTAAGPAEQAPPAAGTPVRGLPAAGRPVRGAAAPRAVGPLAAPRCRRRWLEHPDAERRLAAVHACETEWERGAVALLREREDERDPRVRRAARQLLRRFHVWGPARPTWRDRALANRAGFAPYDRAALRAWRARGAAWSRVQRALLRPRAERRSLPRPERPAQRGLEPGVVPGLRDQGADAELLQTLAGDLLGPAGDDHARRRRTAAGDLLQELGTAHAGHLLIGEDAIDGTLVQDADGLGRGLGRDDLVALAPQRAAQGRQDAGLVVDDEEQRPIRHVGPGTPARPSQASSSWAGSTTRNVVPTPLRLSTSMVPP